MKLPWQRADGPSARDLLAVQFLLSAAAIALVVGTLGVYALHRVARDEALRDATRVTRVLATTAIAPQLDGGLLDGDPAAVARLDTVLADEEVIGPLAVRLKLWTADGELVYSDEKRLMGTGVRPSDEVAEVAASGRPEAHLSDLEAEENRFERGEGQLLEVYVPLTAPDGTKLVVETYQPTSALAAASNRIWRSFLPVLLVVLVALAAAQLPLARWYARRARRDADERLELMARTERVRQDERSQIAADLHDSVVQDLAGVAFDLAAHANQVHRYTPDELAEALRTGAEVSRSSIATLRSMLVQLHPAEQQPALDLTRAIPELAADLKGRGVRVEVAVDRVDVGYEVETLLYRAAQEGVRNVARHAAATRATISLTERDGVATLLIEDDGQGMTSRDLVKQRAAGHVGLTLLADRVRSRRGELTISSEPGRGTRLVVWLPLERADRQPAAS